MSARMTAAVRAYYEQRWPPRALLTALEGRPDAIALAMVSELLTELRAVEAENAARRAQVEAAIGNARQGICAQHSSGGHDHYRFAARCDLARSMLTALQPQPDPVRAGWRIVTLVVRLPLPDRGLSPNARLHWARKRALVEDSRAHAGWTTVAAMKEQAFIVRSEHAHIKLEVAFRLPDKRRRDVDNLVAACKPYFDGIADALGVDDQRFEYTGLTRTIDRANPGVTIEITA